MKAFVRQLGAESGIQLNPLRDNSEIPTTDNADQVFGAIGRFTRGRIDKPFYVDRGNVKKRLGKGESMRASALNEAYVHVVEALNNGAYASVIQRLVPETAVVKWAVCVETAVTFALAYSVSATTPEAPYLFAVKHLDCFNDGIKVEFRADETKTGGVAQDNPYITLRILDSADELLHEFYGSLNPATLDDYGNSAYLPDVVAAQTDSVEVLVGSTTVIDTASPAYGYDTNGQEKWSTSAVLSCFDEDGTTYATSDYSDARVKLQNTVMDYGYIASLGTQNTALLAQLAQLAFDTNTQLRFDVPGDLAPDAAIAFVEQLNFGANQTSHLMHAFWAPLKSNDPTGVNGKDYFGTSTLNIAYACGRNAQTNAYGFAPKNYAIAGREWPLRRTNITQTYTPTNQELNALARAKINPVLFESYTGGGRYVFRDQLTCALVESSSKKLICVADMSSAVDESVTRYGKDVLQFPMSIAVKRMQDYLRELFVNAEASGWLVPSDDPAMGGKSHMFVVEPNAVRPYDRMDVTYSLRYDGANRQTFITQTLSK